MLAFPWPLNEKAGASLGSPGTKRYRFNTKDWPGLVKHHAQNKQKRKIFLFRGFYYYSKTFLPERVVEGSTTGYNRNSLPRDEFLIRKYLLGLFVERIKSIWSSSLSSSSSILLRSSTAHCSNADRGGEII